MWTGRTPNPTKPSPKFQVYVSGSPSGSTVPVASNWTTDPSLAGSGARVNAACGGSLVTTTVRVAVLVDLSPTQSASASVAVTVTVYVPVPAPVKLNDPTSGGMPTLA